ncbi:MAG: hypothetical protein A3F18_05335 [Legionellales bacterium RIFCSPHIGHO2_12_FULL_37_14]|nr:MAG: hypothetical protein A3F18_05335 [Legionellales bacterium RIFCSPHIGHO2_12_FULL_37_14]
MQKDIRWKQRFHNLQKAKATFDRVLAAYHKDTKNEITQIALIQSFEFTYELSYKVMQDYLNYMGIEVSYPREVLKQAFHNNLLKDGQVWIDMLDDRNLMSHAYEKSHADQAISHITTRYVFALNDVFKYFMERY